MWSSNTSIAPWSLLNVPLDVVFLILRLLPLDDVFALFKTCKHFFWVSQCRPFWVYANIDVDFYLRVPGRGTIDYGAVAIDVLQARVSHSLRVYNAWRTNGAKLQHERSMSVDDSVRRVRMIPGTRILILVEECAVRLQAWGSDISQQIPLDLDEHFEVFDVKIFWVDSLQCNIIIVGTTNRKHGPSLCNALKLFRLDIQGPFGVHLLTTSFPHWISAFSLMDDQLVVVGHRLPRKYFLQTFKVVYGHPGSLVPVFNVTLGSNTIGASSLTILDGTHFLFANDVGLSVYRLSMRKEMHSGVPRRITPCWSYKYARFDYLSRPPVGPVVFDCTTGDKSVAICGGKFLRRLVMTAHRPSRFLLSEVDLVAHVPVYLGITAGLRLGLCHIPFHSPTFRTFQLFGGRVDDHPFSSRHSTDGGSLAYRLVSGIVEPRSVDMDEGEGRLVFLLRTTNSMYMVMLEL
ncbi:hypothetical protein B0H16DRAFT_1465187 [Mycena metata]|uniref:F-box domain-containing protein n=1 Tax=Mycena metata TaxID=1033252 RepID=A0AAD7MZY4_9AGAR|nr:hypothetical protein B0H16DRAFT_1465187 [Mycena metata]